MDKKDLQLKEFIKKLVKEYTGTGASGGNAGDGNNITSPRPFKTDKDELIDYVRKNVYGAEGGQWVGDKAKSTFNRTPNVRFESLKKYIKDVLEEMEEQAYGSATLTTQGQYGSKFTKTGKPPGIMEDDPEELKEQVSQAAQRTYEAGLKRLQKGVLRYQIRWIEKQRSAAVSQAAVANQEASKGFEEQIKALQDQIAAIDNPQQAQGGGGQQQNESLLKNYLNERKESNLMVYMDSYKRGVLLEGTVKSLFSKFGKGKSNEDIIKAYASQGIQVPEQFISKVRKQYESLKKLKLEMDFAEQESKDVIVMPNITSNPEPEIESKELSSRLYNEEDINEAKIVKRFELPDGIGNKGLVIVPQDAHSQVAFNVDFYLNKAGIVNTGVETLQNTTGLDTNPNISQNTDPADLTDT